MYVDIGGLDEEKELDGDLWEDEDSKTDKGDCQRMAEACGHSSYVVMDIEEAEGVNVCAPDLLDLLSDQSPFIGVPAQPKATKMTNSTVPKFFTIMRWISRTTVIVGLKWHSIRKIEF